MDISILGLALLPEVSFLLPEGLNTVGFANPELVAAQGRACSVPSFGASPGAQGPLRLAMPGWRGCAFPPQSLWEGPHPASERGRDSGLAG